MSVRGATSRACGSGNVFEDLGLPNPEERLAKARLASKIAAVIERSGEPHISAARIMGIEERGLAQLLRGRLRQFGLAELQAMLERLVDGTPDP